MEINDVDRESETLNVSMSFNEAITLAIFYFNRDQPLPLSEAELNKLSDDVHMIDMLIDEEIERKDLVDIPPLEKQESKYGG